MNAVFAEFTALHVLRHEINMGRIEATPQQKEALDKRYKAVSLFALQRIEADAVYAS